MRSGWPNGTYRKAVSFGRWAARQVGGGDLLVAWAQFALDACRVAKKRGIPTIVVRQSTHALAQREVLNLPWTPLIDRELLEYDEADFVEVPTRLARQTFLDRGFPEKKLITIPPVGADPKVFYPPPEPPKEFRAITVGASRRKGTKVAIEAARLAEVPLWVVGRPESRIEASMGHLGSSVEFLGPVSQPRLAQLYREASVALIPSVEEGLAHAVVEALASGLPIIASVESGAGEVIEHGREGWLIINTDSEMTAEYLARLRASAPLRTRMSTAATETGRRWSWDAYGERAFAAYSMLLGR